LRAGLRRTSSEWREILPVLLEGPSLRQTLGVALVVGLALFAINQLDAVRSGQLTLATWLRIALQFAIPFCVSNYGILTATRRRRTET
jgi:hypothetical protein